MNIEYEATFLNINKDEMRKRLKKAGALLIRLEYLQKRKVFNLPKGHEIPFGWLRVRDEGDKVTLSLKVVEGEKIHNQKELLLEVSSFEDGVELLHLLGCQEKSYQENKRELWKLDEVEITLDEWPFLEPIVEVEGSSEEVVKKVSEKIGFNWQDARFCAGGTLIAEKYGISEDRVNNHTPKIIFNMPNPFLKNL